MKVMTESLKYIDIDPTAAGKLAQQLHIKKEEIPFIRKSFLAEKQEGNAKERSVVSYISTGIKDRDNEALLPGGVKLENYRKNPVVMWAHDYSNLPVGKNIWIKKDEHGLVAKTLFAKSKRGEELFDAYTKDIEGTGPLLKGWSVGFIPKKWEDAKEKGEEDELGMTVPKRTYTEWELLEYSAVPIPSCPEALTLAVEKNLVPEFLKKDLEGEAFIAEGDGVIATAEDVIKAINKNKGEEIIINGTINIDDSTVIKGKVLDEKGKKLTLEEFKKQIIDDHMKGLEMMAFEPEEKEGRVLSKRNRALLSAVIKAVKEALPPLEQLLEATEPDEFGERQYEIIQDGTPAPEMKTDTTAVEKRIDDALVKAIPKALEKGLKEKIGLEIDKIKGKVT